MAKKKGSYSSDEMKRYLGSLKEHFIDGVKAIGEQYSDLKKDVNRIDKKLDSHTEMIGKIMVDIEVMKSDIQIIKSDVKKKVDYDEFSKLEHRVIILESRASRR